MIYTLKNEILAVKVSDLGGELQSVKGNGCEYLWQGDEAYWAGRAPLLFPICGRFFGGKYTYRGKTYEMGTHGFLRHSTLKAEESTDEKLVLSLSDNEETRAQYPFPFLFCVTYTLSGNRLEIKLDVKNTGGDVLPFALGGHPGFAVPLDRGDFSEWFLEFSGECHPEELIFSDTCFNTGRRRPYPLKDNKYLPLRHSLFDIDGVFFAETTGEVTLKSASSLRSMKMEYHDFPYLGIWHSPRTDAPFLCIEPWYGLPSPDGKIEALEEKTNVFRLAPKEEKSLAFSVEFC